ncbi:MAG: phage holin family protein [Nocardiopsaceae bacterium]|nr:phage holin family protein [Nocardiopsaceae bacterium]
MNFLAAAAASGHNSTSTLSNVEPGALGFLIVAGIGLVLVFLLKNMNKQFRKLGPPPEETDAESVPGQAASAEAGSTETGSGPARTSTVRTGDPKQDEKAEGTGRRE